jgi:enoyl-CoA hydratase
MTDEPRVDISVGNGVARLTLVNPTRKGAITLPMTESIYDFCAMVEADQSIGAVIVDAAGNYFCSGADTRDLAASSQDPASPEAVARTSAVYGCFVSIGTLPVPTVSLVDGGAVGAGMNLALATDLMIVTPDAVLDSGFLARGIHPGGGHLRLLGRSLGYQQAIAMAAFGAALTGSDAVELGLAWRTAAKEDLLAVAQQLCSLPAADADLARRIKLSARTVLENPSLSWTGAVEIERGVQMWSLGRKGSAAWAHKPARPSSAASA